MQELQVEKSGVAELFNSAEKLQQPPQVLETVLYPDPVLKLQSKLVTTAIPQDKDLQDLLRNMEHTLQHYRALGLSAIQVGVPLRVMVVRNLELTSENILKIINPVVKSLNKETTYTKEGCLSVPGIYTSILRPQAIQVEYFSETGNKETLVAKDMLARIILHELDHLDGITFFERMNSVQRTSTTKKFNRIKKKL